MAHLSVPRISNQREVASIDCRIVYRLAVFFISNATRVGAAMVTIGDARDDFAQAFREGMPVHTDTVILDVAVDRSRRNHDFFVIARSVATGAIQYLRAGTVYN